MLTSIALSVGFLAASGLIFSGLLVIAERKILNYGTCKIDINSGEKQLEIKGGSSLLSSLAQNNIFIPSACGGRGQVIMARGIFSIAQTCPRCDGAGRVIQKPCKACQGAGRRERGAGHRARGPSNGALLHAGEEGVALGHPLAGGEEAPRGGGRKVVQVDGFMMLSSRTVSLLGSNSSSSHW